MVVLVCVYVYMCMWNANNHDDDFPIANIPYRER